MCGLPIWAQIFLMPDRCKQQPKTRFSTCKTEVVHRCKKWAQKCPYFGRLPRRECRFRPFSAQTQFVLQYSLSFSWRNTWNRYLAIFYEEWWSEILENRCCLVKASHFEKILNSKCWRQNRMEKVNLSGIVSKTGKGFNLPGVVCWIWSSSSPFAGLSSYHACITFLPAPKDIHIRSANKKLRFHYGSELLLTINGSRQMHKTWHCHI